MEERVGNGRRKKRKEKEGKEGEKGREIGGEGKNEGIRNGEGGDGEAKLE